ncbi:MAG: aspartyl/asparaginyl beta-hydroxylase domain-containing protein, partial [Cyanobacteria bacterium P01_G01_bin.38]
MQTAVTQPQSSQTPIHPIFDSGPYRKIEAWLGEQSTVSNSPFFTVEQFPWATKLEANWQVIRDELDQVLQQVDTLPSFQDIMP